jgi:protein O-mannosyl-transferase
VLSNDQATLRSSAEERPWLLPGGILVGCVLVSFLLFSGTLGSFFLSDDFELLRKVREAGPFGVWSGGSGFLRPLISVSLYLDDLIWSGNPMGFHLTAVLLHGLNAFLVYLLARALGIGRTAGRRDLNLPAAAALLFLVLSSHSEPVCWISGRTDLFATLFLLSALATYVAGDRPPRGPRLSLSVALFAAGLLCKESVIAFPLVILAYEAWRRAEPGAERRIAPRLARVSLFFAVLVAYLALRLALLGTLIGGYGSQVHVERNPLLLAANVLLLCYRAVLPHVSLDIVPAGVSPLDVRSGGLEALRGVSPGLVALAALAAGAVLACVGCLLLRRRRGATEARRSRTPLLLLAASFFAAILPVLSLRVSLLNTEGERMVYLPSVFSTLWIVAALERYLPRRAPRLVALALLVLLNAAGLVCAARNWSAAGTLSARIVEDVRLMRPAGRLRVANLPDNLNGAYVFRNGFPDAVRLFGGQGAGSEIRVAFLSTLIHPDDGVRVHGSGGVYGVDLLEPRARFVRANRLVREDYVAEGFEVRREEPRRLQLDARPVLPGDLLCFYSSGGLRLFPR